MPTPRVTYAKTNTTSDAASAYTVFLDGTAMGVVIKVRDSYLHNLGSGRGQNVRRARDAWNVQGQQFNINYDSRADAAVSLVMDHLDTHYGDAVDIVRNRA